MIPDFGMAAQSLFFPLIWNDDSVQPFVLVLHSTRNPLHWIIGNMTKMKYFRDRLRHHATVFLYGLARKKNNKPALVQMVVRKRTGNKPLSKMMMSLFTKKRSKESRIVWYISCRKRQALFVFDAHILCGWKYEYVNWEDTHTSNVPITKSRPIIVMTLSNGIITGGYLSQRPVTRGFDAFFDLRLNKGLSKHSRHRWFETSSRSLWCQCNILW